MKKRITCRRAIYAFVFVISMMCVAAWPFESYGSVDTVNSESSFIYPVGTARTAAMFGNSYQEGCTCFDVYKRGASYYIDFFETYIPMKEIAPIHIGEVEYRYAFEIGTPEAGITFYASVAI